MGFSVGWVPDCRATVTIVDEVAIGLEIALCRKIQLVHVVSCVIVEATSEQIVQRVLYDAVIFNAGSPTVIVVMLEKTVDAKLDVGPRSTSSPLRMTEPELPVV